MEDEKEGRLVRAKRHLKENKKVYIAAVGGLAVGSVGVFVATGGHVTIVEAFKGVHIQYKSPNITIVELERRACPDPIPVMDKLTGEVFASINRAAKMTKTAYAAIRTDAHGAQNRWERLPDSVFA